MAIAASFDRIDSHVWSIVSVSIAKSGTTAELSGAILDQARLLRARRLVIAGQRMNHVGCVQLGYEGAVQFSREYSRWFGLPSSWDALRLTRGISTACRRD
jgi:AraC-like DNA-binding protein